MITKEIALNPPKEFYHKKLRDSRGRPVRARVNGKATTWVTRDWDFSLPMKYGMKECFYITSRNANEWSVEEPVITKVLFRKMRSAGDIIALFPEIIPNAANRAHFISGSVGNCLGVFFETKEFIVTNAKEVVALSKPAKPHSYSRLKKELEEQGYELEVKSRLGSMTPHIQEKTNDNR